MNDDEDEWVVFRLPPPPKVPPDLYTNGVHEDEWKGRPYERIDTPEAQARLKELRRYFEEFPDPFAEEVEEPGPEHVCFICNRPALFTDHDKVGVCSVRCLETEA